MKHDQGTFTGVGGLSLFYQSWQPDQAAQAVLVIVHGAGDHSGRYSRVVQPMLENDIAVYAFDMRGYGRSEGRRGHINAWAEYHDDLQAFLSLVTAQQPRLPVFAFGYSLGAQVLLEYALRSPDGLSGVLLSGTPIEPAGVGSPLQIKLARVLSRYWPTFSISLNLDIKGVTRDMEVLEELLQDPLHHDRVTARWGTEAMQTADWVSSHADQLCLPVFFIHGESDPFNLPAGVQRYYEQVPISDKAIKIYPGCMHETHNDLDSQLVINDMLAWLISHIQSETGELSAPVTAWNGRKPSSKSKKYQE